MNSSYRRLNFVFAALVLPLILCSGCAAAPKPELYGQKIVAPSEGGPTLKLAVDDLAVALHKMTGQPFETATAGTTTSGICLAFVDSPGAPRNAVARLKGEGLESFVITSQDSSRMFIVSNSEAGLSHGIYYYLERLGVRYYFPNDNWTIVPRRNDITLQIDSLICPAFKVHTFFGTGGFGDRSPVDPNHRIRDRWADWQRRNRFGGEFVLNGHAGEAFNLAHKDVLLKHPEYLAKIGGKYSPWSETAKLNTANPEAVQLFVDDRLAQFRKQRKADPGGPESFAVSASPADGGDFCDSEECRRIGNGSASDQVFYVVNQVAKAVAKEFPGGHVNVYAYAGHSAVPSLPLEPNVYVQIIPYAFQDTGLSPQEFIQAWGKKVSGMSLYDYWSIPDWNFDLPAFDYTSAGQEKLRYWNANHINGFTGESTYSAGAMGLSWYVASRVMWDPQVDDKAIIEEFFRDCFGPASPPMKRMLERWAAGFHLGENELGLSFRDLQEAMRLAKNDSAVAARVDDYARYVQYLRLQYENNLPGGTPEEKEKANMELLRYIWSIYDSAMIHTFRLNQFLVDYGRNLKAYQAFDLYNDQAPGWKTVHPPTHEELQNTVDTGVQQFQPLKVSMGRYSRVLRPVTSQPTDPAPFSPKAVFKGPLTLQVQAPPGLRSIDFRVAFETPGKVKLADETGMKIWEVSPKFGDELFKDPPLISLPIAHPGFYTVEILPRAGSFMIQTPAGTPMVFSTFLIDQGSRLDRLYFFVPAGTKQVALTVPYTNLIPDVLDHDGKLVKCQLQQDGGKTMVLDVPHGQDGKVWSLEGVANPNAYFQMLSVPQWFSLRPDTMLAPENTLP